MTRRLQDRVVGRAGSALVAAAVVLAASLLFGGCAAMDQLEAARNLEVETPTDLADISDGRYRGTYDAGLVVVRLTVAVADGRMTGIELEHHENGKGAPAETIVEEVLQEQSLEVDCVSGATVSSKVILKSVERALAAAPRG